MRLKTTKEKFRMAYLLTVSGEPDAIFRSNIRSVIWNARGIKRKIFYMKQYTYRLGKAFITGHL